MKKLLLAASLLLAATVGALAQQTKSSESGSSPFGVGSSTLGVGLGFGVSYNYYGSVKSLPALAVIYDRGLKDNVGPGNIGIGGIIGYKSAHYKYTTGDYKATWTNIIVAARGTYHLAPLSTAKFDPYGGVMLGVRILSYKDTWFDQVGVNPNTYGSVFVASGLFVGAKYNFSEKIGAFAELGYDIAFLKIGIHANL